MIIALLALASPLQGQSPAQQARIPSATVQTNPTLNSSVVRDAALAAPRGAAKWAKRYTTPNTLGVALEERWTRMLQLCRAEVLQKRLHFFSANRTAIPFELQGELAVSRMVLAMPGKRTFNVMRYAYDGDSADLSTFNAGVDKRLMNESIFVPMLVPQPDQNSPGVAHTQTCGTVMASAAQFDLKPPSASLSGALEAEQKRHKTLIVTQGKFVSPLAGLLTAPPTPAGERLALLTVHQLYRSNSGLAVRHPKYIASFHGASVIDLGEFDYSSKLAFDANASGNYLIASGSGKVQFGTNLASDTKTWDYETFVFKDGAGAECAGGHGCMTFDTLPSLVDIRDRLAAARLQVGSPGTELEFAL